VPELIAKPALAGQAPLSILGTTIAPVDLGRITSVAPYPKKTAAVSKALRAIGLSFPNPGTTVEAQGARIVWSGADQALLIGGKTREVVGFGPEYGPDFGPLAATTDQTGAWAALHVTGPFMPQVMARLCPLDFRPAVFKPGQAARAQLGHMNAIFWTQDDGLMILTFRSMARTAFDELAHALNALAARVAVRI
jgi:heterotetrameric sarcosine oxidase gamma subunit